LVTFPLGYTIRSDVDETQEYHNTTIVFYSQKKQKSRGSVNKTQTWKITCEGSNADRQTLIAFHDSVAGDFTPFYFFTPDNLQVTARFTDGKLSINPKRELDITKPTFGNVVGYTCTMTLELAL
jgi:phage-related protein